MHADRRCQCVLRAQGRRRSDLCRGQAEGGAGLWPRDDRSRPGRARRNGERAPGAILASLASPKLPLDRRYRYFDDERAIHRLLDAWQPDHVEASSPWSSATMVGRWQGSATRSLVMHSDPLAAYAYRWLGGIASVATIDRWFGWFWSHLRGLGKLFDTVVCANDQLTERLRDGGIGSAETVPMGVEPGSSRRRCDRRNCAPLRWPRSGSMPNSILLLGVGRFSAEKRWDMVIRAAASSRSAGAGRPAPRRRRPARRKLELLADRFATVAVMPHLADRGELARLLASADALVHGCEAETFCMVAAEARASGIPLIVPDRGAAVDQRVADGGRLSPARCRRSSGRSSTSSIVAPSFNAPPRPERARCARWTSISPNCSRIMQRWRHAAPISAAARASRPERRATGAAAALGRGPERAPAAPR